MELAYRLAVDDSPYVKNIRDHVITLITPIVEVDGRDRIVDVYKWQLAHPARLAERSSTGATTSRTTTTATRWALTLKLTQNVLNTYLDWKAQVLHDLHESVPYLYDNTIGDGPYNAWLDPILTNEWQMIGWNNVQEMTRFGMPGVFAHGNFDTWSPGYLMFIAATHNGISRLYETFGNGGADTEERTLGPNETRAPGTSRIRRCRAHVVAAQQQQLRADRPARLAQLLRRTTASCSSRTSTRRASARSSRRRPKGPAAYVLPADDPRPGAQAELLRVLQKQRVEISRATAPFTVTVPVRSGARGRRRRSTRRTRRPGGANAEARSRRSATPTTAIEREQGAPTGGAGRAAARRRPRRRRARFPAGSYIVRMDQPYSRIADALLDYQYWSPNDPQKTPYDDTGWTFPELSTCRPCASPIRKCSTRRWSA